MSKTSCRSITLSITSRDTVTAARLAVRLAISAEVVAAVTAFAAAETKHVPQPGIQLSQP